MRGNKAQITDVIEVSSGPARLTTRLGRLWPPSEAAWPRVARIFALAAGVVIALRIILSAWGAWVLASSPPDDLQAQYGHLGVPLQLDGLAAPWQREDALWYEKIASQGYGPTDGTTIFPPLMPLLMRLGSVFTGGNAALAGLLIGTLLAVVALALLYRIAMHDVSEATARKSVFYLALFPTAFLLLSAYSEPLFLALVLGAFLAAREKRWMLAAVCAALAGMTRVQGALICLPLAAEYMASIEWKLPTLRRKWHHFLAVSAAAPLGTLAFFLYSRYVVGAPLSWADQQAITMNQQVVPPWEVIATAVNAFFTPGALSVNRFDLIVFALFLVLTIASFRMRVSYGLYALTLIVPTLLHVHPQFPLMSFTRFALVAFPCFIVLAAWSARTRRPRLTHALIVTLWVALLLFWSGQFVQAHWVA